MAVRATPTSERVLRAVLDDMRGGEGGNGRALRATWHLDAGCVVLSIWRDGSCAATARLTPVEAGRLSALLGEGMASLAADAVAAGP